MWAARLACFSSAAWQKHSAAVKSSTKMRKRRLRRAAIKFRLYGFGVPSINSSWAEQTQSSASSTSGHPTELKAKADALRCISGVNDLTILYNHPAMLVCQFAHRCSAPSDGNAAV